MTREDSVAGYAEGRRHRRPTGATTLASPRATSVLMTLQTGTDELLHVTELVMMDDTGAKVIKDTTAGEPKTAKRQLVTLVAQGESEQAGTESARDPPESAYGS